MARSRSVKVLRGRLRVTKDSKSGRLRGVFYKGKFHSAKSTNANFKKFPIKSRVRIAGRKTVYVSQR